MTLTDAVIESMIGRCEECGAQLKIKSMILKKTFWGGRPKEYHVYVRCGTKGCVHRRASYLKRISYDIVQEEIRRAEDRRRRVELGF